MRQADSVDKSSGGYFYVLAILPIVLWASNYVVMKYASNHIHLSAFNSVRFLILVPLLFIVKPPTYNIIKLLLISICWMGLNLYFLGRAIETQLPTGFLALSYVSSTVFVVIISFIINNENLNRTKMTGVIITFLGMLMFAIERKLEWISMIGILYVLLSNFFNALGVVLLNKYNIKADYSTIIYVSALSFFPLAFLSFVDLGVNGVILELKTIDYKEFICILYASLLCTVVGGYVWINVISCIGAINSSFLLFLVPILGYLLGYLFFGELVTTMGLLSSLLVLVGVFYCFYYDSEDKRSKC